MQRHMPVTFGNRKYDKEILNITCKNSRKNNFNSCHDLLVIPRNHRSRLGHCTKMRWKFLNSSTRWIKNMPDALTDLIKSKTFPGSAMFSGSLCLCCHKKLNNFYAFKYTYEYTLRFNLTLPKWKSKTDIQKE